MKWWLRKEEISPVLVRLETAADRLEEVTSEVRARILDLKQEDDPSGAYGKEGHR